MALIKEKLHHPYPVLGPACTQLMFSHSSGQKEQQKSAIVFCNLIITAI